MNNDQAAAALDTTDAAAYASLALYPQDTLIPISSVQQLWSQLSTPARTRPRITAVQRFRLRLFSVR